IAGRARQLQATGADVVGGLQSVAVDEVVRRQRDLALLGRPAEERSQIGVGARRGVVTQREEDVEVPRAIVPGAVPKPTTVRSTADSSSAYSGVVTRSTKRPKPSVTLTVAMSTR